MNTEYLFSHKKILLALSSIITILFHNYAIGVGSFRPTEQELKLLPPYCKPKAVNMHSNTGPFQKYRPLIKKWRNILGPDYDHAHHYCEALQYINKTYNEADQEKRNFYYKIALNNIAYMEQHASKHFILNGEIAYYKGKILEKTGKVPLAIKAYTKSIKLKPKFSAPYKSLFDIYIKLGMIDNAREVLKKGLKNNPKSKSLRKRISVIKKIKANK